jgi:hypothetical protein
VKSDGGFKMRATIEEAKAKLGGELAAMVDPSVMSDAVKGLTTIVQVDGRGRLIDVAFEGTNAIAEQMNMGFDKSFQSGFVPLPEEAVGPGAVWDALGHMDAMGVKARLAARYKLIELNGSQAKVEITLQGTADPQATTLPNAPMSVDLKELTLDGSGTMKIDLERPTRGDMDISVSIKAEMAAQGQTIGMRMTMQMKATPLP